MIPSFPEYARYDLLYLLALHNSTPLKWYFPPVSAPVRGNWKMVQSGSPWTGEAIRHLYICRNHVPAKGQMQGLPRAGARHPTQIGGSHYQTGISLTIHQN